MKLAAGRVQNFKCIDDSNQYFSDYYRMRGQSSVTDVLSIVHEPDLAREDRHAG